MISARVPRIGPDVSTGEAIRIRRLARPRCLAIRCASGSPWSGQNHGRSSASSTLTGLGSTRPECSTSPPSQSSSKFSVKATASSGEATVTIDVLLARPGVIVQFVEPLSTALAVAHAYLWCIRSGTPEIARVSNGRDSMRSGDVDAAAAAPGSALGGRCCRQAHADAARGRGRRARRSRVARPVLEPDVVEARSSDLARGRRGTGQPAGRPRRV